MSVYASPLSGMPHCMATCEVGIWCYLTDSGGSVWTLQRCIKGYEVWQFNKWSGCLIFIGERTCIAIRVLASLVTHSVLSFWLLWYLYHMLKHCSQLCSGSGFNTAITLLWVSSWNSKLDSWMEILFIFRDVESQIRLDQWVILYVPAMVSLIVFGQKLLPWRTFTGTWVLASFKMNLSG